MLKFTEVTYGTVRKESGTPYWLVKESFRWWIKYETKKEKVVVMKGFRTNFGSVPKLIWWLIEPTEWNSFVLHNFLYTSKNLYDFPLEQIIIPDSFNSSHNAPQNSLFIYKIRRPEQTGYKNA